MEVLVPHQEVVCFIPQIKMKSAQALLASIRDWRMDKVQLRAFSGESVAALYFKQMKTCRHAVQLLEQQGISVWEADIKPTDRFLMERFIRAGMAFELSTSANNKNNTVITQRLKPADVNIPLKWISLDIETAFDTGELYSIAVYSDHIQHVFMVKETLSEPWISCYESERALLEAFCDWVQSYDPDGFIGWNVIQFDFRFLIEKCQALKIPFRLGRNNTEVEWRPSQQREEYHFLFIPGRAVLDGIETLRTATFNFERFSLEYVAQSLLGEGKDIEDVDNRAEEIKRKYREEPLSLARYNLEDCRLVWAIFEKTQLFDFVISRAELTGLALDRVGGSVASFENLYMPKMHRAGFVAPNLGSSQLSITAPGGYVMNSKPGIYDNVLVFDFKSLYPSIIRTFKIDPIGLVQGLELNEQSPENDQLIPGFNGAYFHKQRHLLPDIIARLWEERDRAKRSANQPLSQAIKIIMNSFYGVLGSQGCRFYDPRLSSSITMRGHEIIQRTSHWFAQAGYQVIYGDTDSVFVLYGKKAPPEQLWALGKRLAADLNLWWQQTIEEEFGVESILELEFESLYQKFLMPTIRGSEKGSKKRYAGVLCFEEQGQWRQKMQFKGLETVRTDWTELARTVQWQLYEMIFEERPYQDFLQRTVADLLAGKLDEQLVYRKRLRQPLAEYQKNVPPHAKAAIKEEQSRKERGLPKKFGRGSTVEYVITVNGPEPLAFQQSALDYQHYIERQLAPVADTALHFLGESLEALINPQESFF